MAYTYSNRFVFTLHDQYHSWKKYRLFTDDCIYPWTLALKKRVPLTSNVYVSGVKLWSFPAQVAYVTSNVYVKLWNFPTYQWFSQVFLIFLDCDDSEPREHWLCRENFTFGRKKFKVWPLKYRRLRSHKLKIGWENFKVWHLKHRCLTSVENMLLALAFTGRCNRR